jgi:amino acid transporter
MSRAFPIAGSVNAYAARGIGESAGFLAGWMMLLDYSLLPTLIYVVIAVAVQAILPEVPRFIYVILLVAIRRRGARSLAKHCGVSDNDNECRFGS